MNKICTTCKLEKLKTEFHKQSEKKDGLRPICKKCTLAKQKEFYKNNEEMLKKRGKSWRIKNREKILQKQRLNRTKDPQRFKEYDKKFHKLNSERRNALNKIRYEKNKKQISQKLKEKYYSNIQYRIALNLRRRMYKLIKREDRNGSAVKDLGCSLEQFKIYIESKFQLGMNWNNYGMWHLDHIYPLSKVNLENREEFLKVSHYTNYQPLWAKDNIIKGNKCI